MDIIDTFGFNAPAEAVYNNLTDPDRTERSLLAQTMRHLARDVSDNFTAG